MELLQNLESLLRRGWHYWWTEAAKAERGHWWHDTWHGATVGPKDLNFVYTDLHVHVFDSQDPRSLVEEAAKRIDVMALVERVAPENDYHLTFDRFIEKLDAKEISYRYTGENVVCVETTKGPLYVVRSIEVYTHDSGYPRGVIVIGNDKSYDTWHHRRVSLDEVISAAESMGAFWELDHQGVKHAAGIGFRPAEESEIREDKRVYRQLQEHSQGRRPVLEIGNLQVSLWVYFANFIVEEIVNELGLVGIATSDTHFNVREIGLSRTGIPRELMDLSSEDALLTSLNAAITPAHREELLIERNYASLWDFTPYMFLTGLPVVGSYFMQRMRKKHALEELVQHNTLPEQELASHYNSPEKVREALERYNSDDALIVIDIDDCIRDSPAKKMAFKEGWKYAPLKTLKWLLWNGPVAAFQDIVAHRSIKDGETEAFAAYRKHVAAVLSPERRRHLAQASLTPLYDGVQKFIGYFTDAEKILVSRNIKEVVEATREELGCTRAYHEQDDKINKILEAAQGKRRVLILGDSKEDAAVIPELRKFGYHVDFVYVQKKYDFKEIHPDATIAITRKSFSPLYSTLQKAA